MELKREEIEKIKGQFEEVVQYSQHYPYDLDLSEIFGLWESNKKKFIDIFGGLTYEIPLTEGLHLSPDYQRKEIFDFLDELVVNYRNYDLADFVKAQQDSFFNNRVLQKYLYDGKEIPAGMKLVKAFKYFEKDKQLLYIL